MKCDLHLHSAQSDGTDTPSEVVDKAKLLGLDVISITDHDTTSSYAEAKKRADEVGIQLVRGIELSTYSFSEVHILGYNFDNDNVELTEMLQDFEGQRKARANTILDKLEEFRIFLPRDEIVDCSSVGRLHIAKAMVASGYCSSISDAFDRYLGSHGIAYFPSKRTTPFQGVGVISKAGGVAVIAHPLRFLQQGKLIDLIEGLLPFGLQGIEAYYPTHDDKTVDMLLDIAQKYNLLTTGGTDYHGLNKNVEMASIEVNINAKTAQALSIKI